MPLHYIMFFPLPKPTYTINLVILYVTILFWDFEAGNILFIIVSKEKV